jgi:tetratricopeptide (TPR) repeat protein
MKKANLVLMAALAAAGLVGITGGALLPSAVMAADAPKLNAKIVKPLKAAQDATVAKNWDQAYAAWQEAQAVEPKTPYESYMVDEIGWYVLVQKKEYARAAEALERAVNSGFVAAPEVTPRLKALAQLNYQVQNYAKAIEFGNKFLAQVPGDQEVAVLVAQSYYLQKDYAGTRAIVDKLTAGATQPGEQLLLLGLRSSFELKDRAGTMQSLESLIRYFPQPKYWEDLLTNQLYETKGDRELRTLYRLMEQTSTLDKADEYSEMATVLIAGGFPAEAQQVLERGMSANLFSGDARSRAQSDLDRARSGATADRKDVAGADQALAAAKSGNDMVATGKLYFSVADYAKAADAIQKGIAKGGVTDVDDANALLGVALVRSDKAAAARPVFEAVKEAKYARVARLWVLYLDSKAAPAAAPVTPAAPPAG